MKGVRNTTITDAINRSEAIRQKITNLDNQRKNHRLSANLLVHRQVWASEWERLQKYADCCDREIRQYLKSALVEHELSREDAVQYRKLESHIEEMRQCLRPVDPLRSKQAAMLIDAQIDTLQQELAPISSSVQQLEREDEENFSPLSTWILVAVQIEDTKSSKPKVSRVPTLIQNVECIDTTTKFALYEQIIGLVDQRKLVLDGLRKRGSETGERDASHRIAKLMDEYRHFSDSSHLTSRKLLCERMLLEFPGKSESLLVVECDKITSKRHRAEARRAFLTQHNLLLKEIGDSVLEVFKEAERQLRELNDNYVQRSDFEAKRAELHKAVETWTQLKRRAALSKITKSIQFLSDSKYHVKGAPVKNKRKSTPPGLTELTKLVKLAYENETAYLTSLSTQLTKTQPGVIRRQDEAIKIYISRTHEGDERRRRRQATEDVEKAKNDLPSDWNRILSDTCSFSEYLKATKNRESDAQFRVQGLSVDDVFKDKRAKLAYALGENELLHTDYARQLMGKMSLVAAQNMKPHLVSNIAFD